MDGPSTSRRANRRPSISIVDGAKVGSTVADQHRADLTVVTPDGRCAFEFFLPAALMDGTAATGRGARERRGRAAHLRGVQVSVSVARLCGGAARNGSCASDGGCSPSRARTMWSSSAAGAYRLPARRRAASASTARRCRSPSERESTRNGPGTSRRTSCCGTSPAGFRAIREWNDLHFSFGHARPFRPLQDIYYPLFAVPMPDEARRLRVHGNELGNRLRSRGLLGGDQARPGRAPLRWGAARAARAGARLGLRLRADHAVPRTQQDRAVSESISTRTMCAGAPST